MSFILPPAPDCRFGLWLFQWQSPACDYAGNGGVSWWGGIRIRSQKVFGKPTISVVALRTQELSQVPSRERTGIHSPMLTPCLWKDREGGEDR